MQARFTTYRPPLIAAVAVAVFSAAVPALRAVPQVTGIPARTAIAIRTIDPIDSDGTDPSSEYRGSVDDSVVDAGGTTVVPVGAPALLRLVQVQKAGAVRGQAALSLRLVALEVNGGRIDIDTGDATIRSGSQAGSATKKGIWGAIIGSAVGAMVDGKAGAAKGAAIGGAAGVAAAVVIGQRVQVPAETRLSFTLSRPVRLPSQDAMLLRPGVGGRD